MTNRAPPPDDRQHRFGLPLLEQLFDSLPHGVIVLDAAGRVVVYNAAEAALAGRTRDQVLGRDFFVEIAPCMNVRELAGEFRASIGQKKAIDVRVDFSFPFPHMDQPRDVVVTMRSFVSDGAPFGFFIFEDVSLERSIARMREALSGFLVHDLKNPLATILANLEHVLGAEKLSVDASEALGDAQEASRRLQGMLLNLLDVTRLETNTMPLKKVSTSLQGLARDVATQNQAIGRMRAVTVEIDLPAAPLVESIDGDIIRRVLNNLVENAVRYARTRVVVGLETLAGSAVFRIVDDGYGIPAAVRDAVFDKFVQANAGAGASSVNRGLGLTFARLATRAHGGDVSVSCPPEGGTVFRVTIPQQGTPRLT